MQSCEPAVAPPRTSPDLSMTATQPKTVTAVIPVYNGERYVIDAITSVLGQTVRPIECIVVDDGSTDSTAALVAGFGDQVTYLRQPNSGVSVARNHGASHASGELIAFLDHDDLWLPDKLERQLAEHDRIGRGMVLCGVQVIDQHGVVQSERSMRLGPEFLRGVLTFDGTDVISCSSTGLIDRETFDKLGGFDPALGMSADLDLLIRALLHSDLGYVDEPLVRYRWHDTNMSHNVAALEHDMRRVFGKVFADPSLPAELRGERRLADGRLYRMLAGSYLATGDRKDALRLGLEALRSDPRLARTELARVLKRR